MLSLVGERGMRMLSGLLSSEVKISHTSSLKSSRSLFVFSCIVLPPQKSKIFGNQSEAVLTYQHECRSSAIFSSKWSSGKVLCPR